MTTGLHREQVAPGIARLIVPTDTLPPATATNAWLLGEDTLTVVDPGASDPTVQAAVVEALANEVVERIVLTHHHPDHTSGARHLSNATGAPIVAHPDTAPFFGPLDHTVRDADTLATGPWSWTVLHTPGHAHGHICLLRPSDGHVVIGDLLAGEGTILIAPPEGHLATYLHSLRRVRALGAQVALPAHGPALHAPALLDHYLHHRHNRTLQVRSRLTKHAHTPLELASHIYADIPAAFHGIAAHQLQAHLTWLIERDLVQATPAGSYSWTGPADAPPSTPPTR